MEDDKKVVEETKEEVKEAKEETKETKQDAKETTVNLDKLEEIINKGLQQKESSILKSYFQQAGLSEEEIKQAVNDFKENKSKAEAERLSNSENLVKENELLKVQLNNAELNNIININGYELGLDPKTIKAVQKLADFGDIETDGKIDEEKVKLAINNVLEEYPSLKMSKQGNSKVVEVGSPEAKDEKKSSEDELRKMFGIKNKQ